MCLCLGNEFMWMGPSLAGGLLHGDSIWNIGHRLLMVHVLDQHGRLLVRHF